VHSCTAPWWHGRLIYLRWANSGGLRFELSVSGSYVEMFLMAIRKASEVCADIFEAGQAFTACLSVPLWKSAYAYREALRALKACGIEVPHDRCMWVKTEDDPDEHDGKARTLHIAFNAERDLLDNFLWCALGVDLGIRPCPRVGGAIYLMSLPRRVLVHLYDDRGMGVVGSNHQLLARLYAKYGSYLPACDREVMEATFKT
jgi:hypothetical protein